jgi:thaumarchaeosortase
MGYVKDMPFRLTDQIKKLIVTVDFSFVLINVFLLAAFVVPVLTLCFFDASSFDYMWKGRAPYLLFLWLFFLEMFLGWKELEEKRVFPWSKRVLAAAVGFLLPSLYVLSMFVFGLRQEILKWGTTIGVPSSRYGSWFLEFSWPLSVEFIVITIFFIVSVYLVYGLRGLKNFCISSFFIGAIGVFYMIDTFFPYGTFTVLQSFVPLTVSAAANVLNSLGCGTQIFSAGDDGLGLRVMAASGKNFTATVSWPCAGIQSLFIYSFLILLFLRGNNISLRKRIVYFVVGAFGTLLINIIRIVTILIAGLSGGGDIATRFHEFYGEFFFIAWILIYISLVFVFETRLFRGPNILPISHDLDSRNWG